MIPAHAFILGAAERDDHGKARVAFTCTCQRYNNTATGRNVHKAWREARRVHKQHVEKMGEE